MIKKPTGYDEATAYTGEYETLQPGGHICVIKGATVMQTRNGTEMLKIAFDIDESDPQKQGGFYGRQFESNKAKYGSETKWPAGGTHRIGIDGKSVPFFKGFTTIIMESNPGYVWKWDETTLKGKKFGAIFGEEEYRAQDGSIKSSIRVQQLRSVDVILDGVDIPAPKKLSGSSAPAPAYSSPAADMTETEEDLPF